MPKAEEQSTVPPRAGDETAIGSTRSKLVAQTGFHSECGRRAENQDYAAALNKTGAKTIVIAAIADGVGGAKGGRVAAELAVRGFIEGCAGQIANKSPKEAALHAFESMNRWLHTIARRDADLAGMSCTFTGLVCCGRQAYVAHVGDSRLYRLRGDRLEMLTIDHVAGPGRQQILTRAVGAEEDVRIDYLALQNEPFDRYLLCTDGVHGGLREGVLRELLGRRAAPQETAREIVDRALATSVGDNATALVVDIVELPAATYTEIATTLAQSKILAVPSVGATIDGFHLETELSDGRYTRVFGATDTIEARQVVLKFPKPLAGADGPMREAFLRETWIASLVQSQFVGEVLQLNADRPTQLYLALPFYDGETLERRLRRTPVLSLTAGLDIALKLTRGIAAVHRAGVVHRDIKPDNVIIQPPAQRHGTGVKLVDFGIARLKQFSTTDDAAEPGTPSYMAPELFDGMSADERSDQFALGVTVYRMFTVRYPYGEIEPFSHPKFRVPTPMMSHRPDLPAWLDRVVGRALVVNPKDRFEDVLEFMFELEHGADRASPIQVERKPLYERNPLLFWKVVSAILALLLALSFFFLVQSRQHPIPAQYGNGKAAGDGSHLPLKSQDSRAASGPYTPFGSGRDVATRARADRPHCAALRSARPANGAA
jgi:serine/threonine protein phosphatase PrpC/serine/threonine protein kinase